MYEKYKDREFNLCADEVFKALSRGENLKEISASMHFPQLSDEDQKRVFDEGYRIYVFVKAGKIREANVWIKWGFALLGFIALILFMVGWPTAGYRSGQVTIGIFLGIATVVFGLHKRRNPF